MLTLFLRQTQIIFAGGALFVNMRFSIPEFTFNKLKESLRLIPKFHKSEIFLLSFINIL